MDSIVEAVSISYHSFLMEFYTGGSKKVWRNWSRSLQFVAVRKSYKPPRFSSKIQSYKGSTVSDHIKDYISWVDDTLKSNPEDTWMGSLPLFQRPSTSMHVSALLHPISVHVDNHATFKALKASVIKYKEAAECRMNFKLLDGLARKVSIIDS